MTRNERKKLIRKVKQNARRFFKKFFYRFASRLLEIAALVGIGHALGLRLVRY